MVQLGRNANGEVLVPGRVPDCYLGLHLDSGGTEAAGVLVVAPAALLHPHVLRPDGSMLYDLVTGHPDRAPHELVFLADLSVELGAWASGTWTRLGVDQRAAAGGSAGHAGQGDRTCGCLRLRQSPWVPEAAQSLRRRWSTWPGLRGSQRQTPVSGPPYAVGGFRTPRELWSKAVDEPLA